jgi:hypothetical protein
LEDDESDEDLVPEIVHILVVVHEEVDIVGGFLIDRGT